MAQFFDFGVHESTTKPCPEIQRIIEASQKFPDFTFVEVRSSGTPGDTVVLDCVCQEIGSKNLAGIRSRERLAVVFSPPVDSENPYSVRAIRVGFPFTVHQNSVLEGEPPSLCLYLEPWESLERSWTSEGFLKRIQWWLVQASRGDLHAEDQALEQLFFRSPITVALPRRAVQGPDMSFGLRGFYWDSGGDSTLFVRCLENSQPDANKCCHVLGLSSVVHGPIMPTPRTLGALERQLQSRGTGFVASLRSTIKAMIPPDGKKKPHGDEFWNNQSLIILQVPMKRTVDGEVERVDLRGFLIGASILDIGVALGTLATMDQQTYFNVRYIGDIASTETVAWEGLPITQVEVLEPLTMARARRMSAIDPIHGDFQGLFAGTGALGSAIALVWAREAWGHWTLVDPDLVRPHNLARHVAFDGHIGRPKVQVVAELMNQVYPGEQPDHVPVVAKAATFLAPQKAETLAAFDLILDVSTTLSLPRELAQSTVAKRCVSAFLNPLGTSSVLVIEDLARQVRLDTLEAQYYRSIINEPWGAHHLLGNTSRFSVGAGCRDVSVAISNELIQLHGALLARQIRQRSLQSEAAVTIFTNDDESGSVTSHSINVATPVVQKCGDWEILLDSSLIDRLTALRSKTLPLETGGIVVGYKDFKLSRITVVDVLRQPTDSSASPGFFVRGKEGTLEEIKEIRRRTGEIVDYLGEWHSHPDGVPCSPSTTDVNLLQTMGELVSLEGHPFLMLIVCQDEVRSFLALENK